ncbi:2'-5' RNA ligase family protein [Solitalea sp. MAHUQ-68]|uniref:2'-5' RNA ligase family protein n=1 Tax=Solitalea agri TaxID=2953739 RepID=A0A9X2F3A2_9SPHI|nr:2'-5' RNA ligase family protein [Solitalea agri]MCO4293375.1 2'-5' RNA ligase family protein [Solitalea agri]
MGLYLLAILPNELISNEIIAWKELFATKYNATYGLKVLPHITLKPPFVLKESFINTLISELRHFTKHEFSFKINLEGFGFFTGKKSDVVYVKLTDTSNLHQFYERLVTFLNNQSMSILHLEPSARYTPHLTIAYRDLSLEARKMAWLEFENLNYVRTFDVSEFHLLKHDGKHWRAHTSFKLKKGVVG